MKQGSQSLVVSTTWNTLSSGVANPKEKERRREWDIVTKLTEMPRPVSERIMTMRLPLSKDKFATIISVYAPRKTNQDEKRRPSTTSWQLCSVAQLCSRLYIPEWRRMLVLEGKSRNRSVLQMWSSKVVYWPHALLNLPISNARRGFPRGWRLDTVQTERWPIQRRTLQAEDQYYSDTDERAAIRRWQCTFCPLCWRDA